MERLKSLIAPFGIITVFGLVVWLTVNHEVKARADKQMYVAHVEAQPVNPRLEAAYRDFAWYRAVCELAKADLPSRIEAVAYANAANPHEMQEDQRRGLIVRNKLDEARRRLPLAEQISRKSGDPLPQWAARAMLYRAQADMHLRQEVLKSLGRPCLVFSADQRMALDSNFASLVERVNQHWGENCTGPNIPETFPVTLP